MEKIDENENFTNNIENNENEEKNCKWISNVLDDYIRDFEWTEEMENNAKEVINEDSAINDEEKLKYLDNQDRSWEKFYKFNKTNFFKDRHYLLKEFTEMKDDERDSITLLDIGCGVGNTFYPLLKRKPSLSVKGFDISKRAITLAKV